MYRTFGTLLSGVLLSPMMIGGLNAGSLSMSFEDITNTVDPPAIDVTAEGTTDWVLFTIDPDDVNYEANPSTNLFSPYPPDVRKATGSSIGEMTTTADGFTSIARFLPQQYSWSDGDPIEDGTESASLVVRRQINTHDNTMSFDVTATTDPQQLRVYVTAFRTAMDVTASLSDGSAQDATLFDVFDLPTPRDNTGVLTIDFTADNPGAMLNLTLSEGTNDDNNFQSFGVSAATLVRPNAGDMLQAGDADQDLDFDQLDLVVVQIAAKYLTGNAATWGEGDWDGAPGGEPGNPPLGNGLFDQLDIISALAPGLYLTGPYAAVAANGTPDDGQTSVGYNASTGELWVDAPLDTELTSINIDSEAGIFTGNPSENLGGSFDNDSDDNIFKATFGSSFGSLSFGMVAQAGLSENFVANDLTVVGSLAGGGDLGTVDLIYVPEPSAVVLLTLAVIGMLFPRRRR